MLRRRDGGRFALDRIGAPLVYEANADDRGAKMQRNKAAAYGSGELWPPRHARIEDVAPREPMDSGRRIGQTVPMGDVRHEPSMEDILASIKRIIADDGSAALTSPRVRGARPVAVPAPEPQAEEEDDDAPAAEADAADPEPQAEAEPEVLELTEAVAPPPVASVQREAPREPASPSKPAEVSIRAVPKSPKSTAEEPMPQPTAAPQAAAPIVSDDAAQASRQSLAQLSALLVQPDPEVPGNTLEGLVREMLRPMLKEWLDAKLPEMVEGLVAKEIARITGRV